MWKELIYSEGYQNVFWLTNKYLYNPVCCVNYGVWRLFITNWALNMILN